MLGDDGHPRGYAELSYHGLEGSHLTVINRPVVVSVLWQVDPLLSSEKFEVRELNGWVVLQTLIVASGE